MNDKLQSILIYLTSRIEYCHKKNLEFHDKAKRYLDQGLYTESTNQLSFATRWNAKRIECQSILEKIEHGDLMTIKEEI